MPESPLVPDSFDVPMTFEGPGFRLEPLSPMHNERDHRAWMGSIDHIHSTPGMEIWEWPTPMTLEENLKDMEMHYQEFVERRSFTYSILDGDEVIGCVYIYPRDSEPSSADIRSWVTQSRSEMDVVVWRSLTEWISDQWPFATIRYAARN